MIMIWTHPGDHHYIVPSEWLNVMYAVWEGTDEVRSDEGEKGDPLVVARLRGTHHWLPLNWRAV